MTGETVLPTLTAAVMAGSMDTVETLLPSRVLNVATAAFSGATGWTGRVGAHVEGTSVILEVALQAEISALDAADLTVTFGACLTADCVQVETMRVPITATLLRSRPATSVASWAHPLASRLNAQPGGTRVVDTELTVVLADEEDAASAETLAAGVGAVIVGGSAFLDLYQLRFTSAAAATTGLATLRADGRVRSAGVFTQGQDGAHAQPDEWNGVPTENFQFGSDAVSFTDVAGLTEIAGFTNLELAWDWGTGQTHDVRIFVTDSDIYTLHHQLFNADGRPPRHNHNPGVISMDTWANRANFTEPLFHGTHVTGTICAQGNDAQGTYGVAWGCNNLNVYDVGEAGGVFNLDIPRMAAFMANAPGGIPHVVNMSFGTVCADTGVQSLDPAGDYVDQYRRLFERFPNTLFVAAAGNCGVELENMDGTYTAVPAALGATANNVVTVANVDTFAGKDGNDRWQMAASSNRGGAVTIAAPGTSIWSTAHICIPGATCTSAYNQLTGTSMAAPFVTGVAVLMKQLAPTATPEQLKACLESSGADNDVDGLAAGLIDAKKALDCIGCPVGATEVVPGVGTSVCVAAGTFTMGCLAGRDDLQDTCGAGEQPAHPVTITRNFWMLEREVSAESYDAIHTDTTFVVACADRAQCAVATSWNDAVAYADSLNALLGLETCGMNPSIRCKGWRLPTEAEWEFAARGGQDFVFPGSNNASTVAWFADNMGAPQESCSLAPNALGLCDMAGNFAEWTMDGALISATGMGLPYPAFNPMDPPVEDPVVPQRFFQGFSVRMVRGGDAVAPRRGVRNAQRNASLEVADGITNQFPGVAIRLVRSVP